MEWRDAHIIPRYGAAGVRTFAFLMPAGFPRAGVGWYIINYYVPVIGVIHVMIFARLLQAGAQSG